MKVFAIVALCLSATISFGATVNVTIGTGLTFTPNPVPIKVGDTVQWNWSGASHSTTSNATTGPDAWDSGVKATGVFTHTFNTAGDFAYYCTLHSTPTGTAMNGTVHVTAPVIVPASCPIVGTTGDLIDRGFYVSSFAGSKLQTVTLAYTAGTAGTYTVTLTAHLNTYDGTVLGSQMVTLAVPATTYTTAGFNFGGVAVPAASTVAFTQMASGPGSLFFNRGPCADVCSTCPNVVETNDTTPPLSSFLRGSVGLRIGPTPGIAGDYSGDGKADILLVDPSTNIGMWIMNGTTITSGAFVGSAGSYTVVGIGDFNGDGFDDILLRDSLGNIGMWLMNGTTIIGGALVGSPGSYTVAGVGDFDGDGKSDILLRDSGGNLGVWLMNGPTIVAGGFYGSPGASATVAGIGDLDGDGKADIVLRDSAGNLGVWFINGTSIASGSFIGAAGASVSVAGVADFNGDGKADILLADSAGNLGMWLMNGSTISSGAFVGAAGSSTVVATRDYTGDGKADILLRDSMGNLGMWIMNGTSITSGAFVGNPGAGDTEY